MALGLAVRPCLRCNRRIKTPVGRRICNRCHRGDKDYVDRVYRVSRVRRG